MSLHKIDENWPDSLRQNFSSVILRYSLLKDDQKSELLKAIHSGFWNNALLIQLIYAIHHWKANATIYEIAPLEAKLLYYSRCMKADLDKITVKPISQNNVS